MSVITLFTLSSTYTVRFLPPGVEHEQAFREVVFFLNKRLDVVLGQESRVPFSFLFPVPVAGDASGVGKDAPSRDQRQRFGQIQNGRFV